jgi:hypothetical protein
MKRTLVAAFAVCCTASHASEYRCPQTYPGKDASGIPLTGAFMMWGERPSSGPPFPSGWLVGDDRVAQEGIDIRYGLSEPPEPNWLICEYGSRKRIKGRFHDGHEWGQYMEGHGKEVWFMRLAPKDTDCTVQIREIKTREPGKSTWTVTATCKPTR